MYETPTGTCHQMMTGRAAEEITIVCLDALMFAKSVLRMDCQLLNCSFLSAIIFLSYQNLAAKVASD